MTVNVDSDQYEVSWGYPGNCTCTCVIKQVHINDIPKRRGRKPKNYVEPIPEKTILNFSVFASPVQCSSRNAQRKEALEAALFKAFGGRDAKEVKQTFWRAYANLTQTPRWTKM
jgi:hypothetical protein